MSRLTLRLPASLRESIERQANAEGVSMNQYIVYLLAQATSLETLARQRERYDAIITRVPEADAEAALDDLIAMRDAGT